MGRSLRSARVTPELIWFVASAPRRADPYPAYRRLQRLDPVHHSPLGVWVLSRHPEVVAAFRNPALSSDVRHIDSATLHIGPLRRVLGRGGAETETGPFFDRVPDLMLFQDPPDHTRLRSLASRAFTQRRVRALEPRIRAIADDLLDAIERDGRAELMGAFAYPSPARVICELIGVPLVDLHHIVDHAPALAAGLDPGPLLTPAARDAANQAITAITTYLDRLIDGRRAALGDDLLSALLAKDGDDTLTHDELVNTILLLLIAGHETTANLLGNGLIALLDQPDRLAELRRDPALDAAAVDELLRFDSPVQMTMRVATDTVRIAGRTVDPGSIVISAPEPPTTTTAPSPTPTVSIGTASRTPIWPSAAASITASVPRSRAPKLASPCARSSTAFQTSPSTENRCDDPASPSAVWLRSRCGGVRRVR